MNQVNAIVNLAPTRLNRPLETWRPRQLHSFVAEFRNIPDDVTSVVVRVFKPTGGYYDIPVSRKGDTDTGLAYVVGTCFTDIGGSRYEVHAYDARGNMTALGEGLVSVDYFTASASPLVPGQPVPVMQITDKTGALHTISAVPDGEGGFTTIIDAD